MYVHALATVPIIYLSFYCSLVLVLFFQAAHHQNPYVCPFFVVHVLTVLLSSTPK